MKIQSMIFQIYLIFVGVAHAGQVHDPSGRYVCEGDLLVSGGQSFAGAIEKTRGLRVEVSKLGSGRFSIEGLSIPYGATARELEEKSDWPLTYSHPKFPDELEINLSSSARLSMSAIGSDGEKIVTTYLQCHKRLQKN